MKRQSGMTMLEVTIALILSSALVLAGTGGLRYFNWHLDSNEVKSEVSLLRIALEDYYLSHCRQAPFPPPTAANLVLEELLPVSFNFNNSLGSNYAVSINTGVVPPQYTIALTLDAGLDGNFYRQHLDATNVVGQVLSWTYPILSSKQYQENSLDRFQGFYGSRC